MDPITGDFKCDSGSYCAGEFPSISQKFSGLLLRIGHVANHLSIVRSGCPGWPRKITGRCDAAQRRCLAPCSRWGDPAFSGPSRAGFPAFERRTRRSNGPSPRTTARSVNTGGVCLPYRAKRAPSLNPEGSGRHLPVPVGPAPTRCMIPQRERRSAPVRWISSCVRALERGGARAPLPAPHLCGLTLHEDPSLHLDIRLTDELPKAVCRECLKDH